MAPIIYKTVRVGNLVWMAENLRDRKLNNGNTIYLATTNDDWYINNQIELMKPVCCYISDKQELSEKGDDYSEGWRSYDRREGDEPPITTTTLVTTTEAPEEDYYREPGIGDPLEGYYNTRETRPYGQYGLLYNIWALTGDGLSNRLVRNFTGHPTYPDQQGWRAPTVNDVTNWLTYMNDVFGIPSSDRGFYLKSNTPVRRYISGRRSSGIVSDADWDNYNSDFGGGNDAFNFRALPAGHRRYSPKSRGEWFDYRHERATFHLLSNKVPGMTHDAMVLFHMNIAVAIGEYYSGTGASVRFCRTPTADDPPTGEYCQDYVGNE